MREIQDAELKDIQLQILKSVDLFCREYNIEYSLAFGTMLGAVRHKGYIPWDDDIDICMPRESYELFITKFKNSRFAKQYAVVDSISNIHYDYPYAKVVDCNTLLIENINSPMELGVYIDVFPLDYVPDNTICRWFHFSRIKFWRDCLDLKNIKVIKQRSALKNLILRVSSFVLWPLSRKWISNRISSIASSVKQSNTVSCSVWGYGIKGCFPYEIIKSYLELPFETKSFMSFSEYDTILRIVYGDYMKLPPVEKQISHHSFKAFWRE